MNSETVRSLFNDLSPNYDRLNRIFSLGMDIGWRRQLVAAVARRLLEDSRSTGRAAEVALQALRALYLTLDSQPRTHR